jgi:NADPH:quinone reductase-like Zn-dependent oxidoreductase
MSSNKAIIVLGPQHAQVVECPVLTLPEDHVLIKTHAVALNPHDWRVVDFMGKAGSRFGCDYSGIVEEVGSKVTKDLKKGGQSRSSSSFQQPIVFTGAICGSI